MRQYASSVLLAVSSPKKVVVLSGTWHARFSHALVPMWVVVLVYGAIVALLIAAVVLIVRAAPRMTKPGRIIVAIVGAWTIVAAIGVFLDAYRPTGDWGGSIVESGFVVVYGLVAAGVVLAIDKVVRRIRATSMAAPRARPSR
jgi:hypothetical protein